MMTNCIPKACLNELQKIQRAFIWGDEDGNRKYHAVSWDKVTKPKALGGLGLRRLVHMNKACLMKLGWAIRSGKEALWIDVMKRKYVRQNSNFENPIVRVQDSCLWKSLTDALHSLNIYDFWAIGNGNSVSAWHDRWLFPGKSIEEFGIVIPDNMQQLMVKDLVNDNGFWKLDILSSWLPQNIISKLFAIVPPNNDSEIDRRAWSGSPDGNFTIASAYTLLCRFNDEGMRREMQCGCIYGD
jgi:hypothetical protein